MEGCGVPVTFTQIEKLFSQTWVSTVADGASTVKKYFVKISQLKIKVLLSFHTPTVNVDVMDVRIVYGRNSLTVNDLSEDFNSI